MKLSKLWILLLVSQVSLAAQVDIDVIYGEDNRKDVYEATDRMMLEASKSTAAMVPPTNLKDAGSTFEVLGKTMEARGICATEKFAKQISASLCSGFLIADNILVTAGHCIKDESNCSTYKWVFDYNTSKAGQSKWSVNKTSVYSCKKIISRALSASDQNDFAMIELDRKVTGRKPLPFRKTGKISANTDIVVIGHPSGLPTKISDGASVRKLSAKFFVANLDTYGGNSGSAVLNGKTGEVEGILVRGENDYVPAQDGRSCQVSTMCTNTGCRGEDVTYITNIPKLP